MYQPSPHNSVLALYPNTRGVGYSFFRSMDEHTQSGMITTRNRFTNERYLIRIKKLIEKYQPDTIVIDEYRLNRGSVRGGRTRELLRETATYAKKRNIKVQCYKRQRVREVFSFYGIMKKYDIAQLICHWIPDLGDVMYRERSGQRMEPYSSALFDAVSLVVTYYYLNT